MILKYKIINNLMQKGKQIKIEKILDKSVKVLQKISKKSVKELIQLSIILFSKVFKIINTKKKIEIISSFINNKNKRFAFSIKLILLSAKNKYFNFLYYNLIDEFFLITQRKNDSIKIKKKLEKRILNKKYLLKYYR